MSSAGAGPPTPRSTGESGPGPSGTVDDAVDAVDEHVELDEDLLGASAGGSSWEGTFTSLSRLAAESGSLVKRPRG